jgi:hypothetical protein
MRPISADNPLIFARIGWMRFYGRVTEDADPEGGGSYNDENVGSENNNFQIINGRCYGYAQVPKTDKLGFALERVSPHIIQLHTPSVAGILVILVASNPQVIVGWYRSAVLYRQYRDRANLSENSDNFYNFEAAAEHCTLLPTAERNHHIPKGAGALGQSNVCYSREPDGSPKRHQWIADAIAFVNTYNGPNLVVDPEFEYGKYAKRKPTQHERLEIASQYVDAKVHEGRMSDAKAASYLRSYLRSNYIEHVEKTTWPQYGVIRRFLNAGKALRALKVYHSIMVTDRGLLADFNTPYGATPSGKRRAVLLCNGVPMLKGLSRKRLRPKEELWECAVSGVKYAIARDPLVVRELD